MERGVAATGPILAFVVGFVDTAVFVHMGGLFVAHVTGNLVLLGATLAGPGMAGGHAGVAALQLATFPIFFLSAFGTAVVGSAIKRTESFPLIGILWIASLVMVLAVGLSVLWPGGAAAALVLVVAMAMLNAAQRLDPRLGAPFTVMTGNVTALAITFATLTRLAPKIGPIKGARALTMLVSCFAVGAAAGATGDAWLGLSAVALPTFVMVGHLMFGLRTEPAK